MESTSLVETGSFAAMDSVACERMSAFMVSLQMKAGVKATKTMDCHDKRAELQTAFNASFYAIAQMIKETNQSAYDNRSRCLSAATYRYKWEVEGPDKIDDRIEEAAKEIHDAQLEIAALEPRLHDVEHAMTRMDRYIGHLNTTCTVDESLSEHLHTVHDLIKNLQACPGRNDFTIDVPHWNNIAA